MSEELVTISPSSSLSTARELMREHRIHHLLVTKAAGELLGILSATDFLKLLDLSQNGVNVGAYSVGDLMTRGLAQVEASDAVRTAVDLFALNKFHALPVVESGKPVGIVTPHDIIKLLNTEKASLADYAEL